MGRSFRSYAVLFLCFGFLFGSCDKEVPNPITLTTIDWSNVEATFTIPVISDTLPHTGIASASLKPNLDSLIKAMTANVFSIENVDSMWCRSCTLIILNDDANNNFQNFRFAGITTHTDADLTPVSIASVTNTATGYASSLPLLVVPPAAGKKVVYKYPYRDIFYDCDGTMSKPTTKTLNMKVRMDYTIHLK